MTATASKTSTIVENLLKAAAATGVTLPPELDLEEAARAPYAGPPSVELRNRIAVCGTDPDKHREAFARLGKQLFPAEVWHQLTQNRDAFSAGLHQIMKAGALPTGEELCVALREHGTPEMVFRALGAAEDFRGGREATEQAPMTTKAIRRLARHRGLHHVDPSAVLTLSVRAQDGGYDQEDLDWFRSLGHMVLSRDPELTSRTQYTGVPRLLEEETDALIGYGDPGSLYIALRYGRITDERKHAVAAVPGGLRLITAFEPEVALFKMTRTGANPLGLVLRRAAVDRPKELTRLHPEVARWVFRHVSLAQVPQHVRLDVIKRAGVEHDWLWHAQQVNPATVEDVRAAIAAGMITAHHVATAAGRLLGDRDWFGEAVATVPGVGDAFMEAATYTGRDEFRRLALQAMLPHVDAALGGNSHLWARLLASKDTPGSLFSERSLTDVALILTSRWEQAAQRTR